jgi:hypothetical protein
LAYEHLIAIDLEDKKMGFMEKMYSKKGRKTITTVIAIILVLAMIIPLLGSALF